MNWLDTAVQVSIVAGFVGGVFTYVVLRPLNFTIKDLRLAIQDLRKDLKDCEERRHMMEIKLAEIDQRARVAHSRIDELMKFCPYKHGFVHEQHERTVNEDEMVEHR